MALMTSIAYGFMLIGAAIILISIFFIMLQSPLSNQSAFGTFPRDNGKIGAKREVKEIIRDSYEIQKLRFDLIKSAELEILIIFSTANAFRSQQRAGLLQLLKQAPARGVKVRVLVPLHNKIKEIQKQLKGLGIDFRDNKKPLRAKLTTLGVDNGLSLTEELRGHSKERSEETIRLATYSNSESTVLAYVSIFEMMWMEPEPRYRCSNRKERRQKQQKQIPKEHCGSRPKLFY